MTNRGLLALLVLAVFAAGCTQELPPVDTNSESAPSSQPSSSTAPSTESVTIPPTQPAPEYTLEQLPMTLTVEGSQSLYLRDARDGRLLFSITSREITDPATTASRRYTSQLLIVNAATGEIETTWEPEMASRYQSAILTGADSVLGCVCTDVESQAGSQADHIVVLDSRQTVVAQVEGNLFIPYDIGADTFLIPYDNFDEEDGEISFGLVCIEDGGLSDSLSWLPERLGSVQMSAFGDRFCYLLEDDDPGSFVTADRSGELYRIPFDTSAGKLDSFCLTEQGILASMQTEAGHVCTLYAPDGSAATLDLSRSSPDGLFRLTAGESVALAVDMEFRLFLVDLRSGTPSVHRVNSDLLPAHGSIAIFHDSGDGFFLYNSSAGKLFYL